MDYKTRLVEIDVTRTRLGLNVWRVDCRAVIVVGLVIIRGLSNMSDGFEVAASCPSLVVRRPSGEESEVFGSERRVDGAEVYPGPRKRCLESGEGLEYLPVECCSSVRCGPCQGFARYICKRCHRRYFCGPNCLYKNGSRCNRGLCTSRPMKVCGTCGGGSYDVFSCPICRVSICSRDCWRQNWLSHKTRHQREMEEID